MRSLSANGGWNSLRLRSIGKTNSCSHILITVSSVIGRSQICLEPTPPLLPAERTLLLQRVVSTPALDLLFGPLRSPFNAVASYPIVGLAGKTPVADRWVERDRLAIKKQCPIRGPYRRYNLIPAPAKAQMRRSSEAYRNVNRPTCDEAR